MKRRWLFGFLSVVFLMILLAGIRAWWHEGPIAGIGHGGIVGHATGLSLLPPLVAIVLAITTREVIVSLFAGIWTGAMLLTTLHPVAGTAHTLEILVVAAADRDHISIIILSLLLGGMVGVISRSGGARGLVSGLRGIATNRQRGQVLAAGSALFIFFDDYANTLIRGNALRPMTDHLLISREKLAYIVDSTAAPLAVSAVVTTWIGFEITQIQQALSSLAQTTVDPHLAQQMETGAAGAFTIFLHSLPYLFYPLFALGFVVMIVLSNRDFGPMLAAERRAFRGGGVVRPGSVPASDSTLRTLQPPEHVGGKWYNAVVPILAVVLVAMAGLYHTGASALAPETRSMTLIIGNADPFAALLWASFSGCAIAMAMAVGQGLMSLGETVEALVGGMQSMLIAVIILILAWGLGDITQAVGTGLFLASLFEQSLPLQILPGLVFLIAAMTAFSTGTSWGTMAILFPVVIPLAVSMGAGVGFAGGEDYPILLGVISSVMAGAVFGDHCSPISDTTVLSSMSSGCDLVDHVRTQLPYALVVAAVAMAVGVVPAAFGLNPWWALLLGFTILYALLRAMGKNPESP